MNAISLYSGGCDGLSLAASWVGIETLAFCESDKACHELIAQRHPDKPIFLSDTEVTTDALCKNGIDPEEIDIILSSPPCQCASVAGKRLGAADDRNRWPECLRIVRDVRPRWFLAENVPGLLSVDAGRLFGEILRELAEMGYDACWGVYGAADVGAPHKRDRLCLVAYNNDKREQQPQRYIQEGGRRIKYSGEMVNTDGGGLQGNNRRKSERCFVGDAERGKLWHDRENNRQAHRKIDTSSNTSDSFRALGDLDSERRRKFAISIKRKPHINIRGFSADEIERTDQSGLGGMLNGISCRLDAQRWPAGRGEKQYYWEPPRVITGLRNRATRIRMLGNAVVPQWAFIPLRMIIEIEKQTGMNRPKNQCKNLLNSPE